MKTEKTLRKKIINSVKEYYKFKYDIKQEFKLGDKISYGGRFFDEAEMCNAVEASLDFWLTTGKYCEQFEERLADFLGVKYCSLTNSGSSANLLAFMALTSVKLGARRIKKGDEVITVAAGFPTTVTPIIQYGAVPVFVDIEVPGYNIDVAQLEQALSNQSKAVMIAHTLGNPFNIEAVLKFCEKHNLWLVEDNCDALGSRYFLQGSWKNTGTIGHIGTSSFYPPHHITMGEGGAVYTDDLQLKRIIESFRDWGRDCWCQSGTDNTCKQRYAKKFGELPVGYDHKYVYSHFGYNLKATEMQAAIGCAQLDKLPYIIKQRRENWQYIYSRLENLKNVLILPREEENSESSWFGFLITVKESAAFSRTELVQYLEDHNIQTRLLFAGNLIKHPCFDEMRAEKKGYRVIGDLSNTDFVMNNAFWIGVYPGMTKAMLDYMVNKIHDFVLIKS